VDDARRHVKSTEKEYGLVVLDAFRGRSIPFHLATQEFLLELKEKMSSDGVVIVNIISALEGEDAEAFLLLHSTFSSVFSNVVVFPTDENPEELMNIVIIATDKDVALFLEEHEGEFYSSPVPGREPLTDELNPIEIYAVN